MLADSHNSTYLGMGYIKLCLNSHKYVYTDMVTSVHGSRQYGHMGKEVGTRVKETEKIDCSNSYVFFSTFILNRWRQQEQGRKYSHPSVSMENWL